MAEIMVTAAELRRKADELRKLDEQFKSEVGNLSDTENSLNGMWEGQSHDAFHNAFQHDKAQWDNFYTVIQNYCTALENIATKYEQVENQNAEIANTRTYS